MREHGEQEEAAAYLVRLAPSGIMPFRWLGADQRPCGEQPAATVCAERVPALLGQCEALPVWPGIAPTMRRQAEIHGLLAFVVAKPQGGGRVPSTATLPRRSFETTTRRGSLVSGTRGRGCRPSAGRLSGRLLRQRDGRRLVRHAGTRIRRGMVRPRPASFRIGVPEVQRVTNAMRRCPPGNSPERVGPPVSTLSGVARSGGPKPSFEGPIDLGLGEGLPSIGYRSSRSRGRRPSTVDRNGIGLGEKKMSNWTLFNNWMKFQHLTMMEGINSAFVIGYRVTEFPSTNEKWTIRFNRFKIREPKAVGGATKMMREAVPGLMRYLRVNVSRTVFIPVPSSKEIVASGKNPLSEMTRICAEASMARFRLDVVTQKAGRSLRDTKSLDTRREVLRRRDYESRKIGADNIIIFDDLITTGGTMSYMAQAIHKVNDRVNVYGIALAKTERRKDIKNSCINDHISVRWDKLWQEGEAQ